MNRLGLFAISAMGVDGKWAFLNLRPSSTDGLFECVWGDIENSMIGTKPVSVSQLLELVKKQVIRHTVVNADTIRVVELAFVTVDEKPEPHTCSCMGECNC